MLGWIVGGAIVATATHNMNKAEKITKNTIAKDVKSYTKESEAAQLINISRQEMDRSFDRLANRKNGILSTSMKRFLEVYEKIMKINWQSEDAICDLTIIRNKSEITNIRTSVSASTIKLSKTEKVVRAIGSPFFFSDVMQAEDNLALAKKRSSYASMVYANAETSSVVMSNFQKRADSISDILTKLNVLFVRSIETTEEIINRNGRERSNYSKEEREYLMICINLASTIKHLIDEPIVDEHAELTQKSLQLLQESQSLLNQLEDII